MSATAPLEATLAATREVMAAIQPDQMQAQSPCAQWDVAGVVNHVVGAQGFFTAALTGQPPAEGENWAEGDYLAAYDQAAATMLEQFQQDGVMERTVSLPFGDMPGSAFMGMAMTDIFTHAWDMAKATGQSTDIAPELAAGILERSRQSVSPEWRGPEDSPAPFGLEQECASDACAADQLAAFLGRSV